MRIYLIFMSGFTDPDALAAFLDADSKIRNWYQYGNVLAVLSVHTLAEMQKVFAPFFGGQSFVIAPAVGAAVGGSMPPNFWNFINHPRDAGVWPPLAASGAPESAQLAPDRLS